LTKNWKIRGRKQRRDVGKYSFVNSTITDWKQLTGGKMGLSPVIHIALERELGKREPVRRSEGDKSEVKGSEVLISKLK
jgi:hypothetical protein